MDIAYFLIAISGISLLCGGMAFAVIDWLLYSYLFTKLNPRLRDSTSFVFGFVAGFAVTGVVLAHLFLGTMAAAGHNVGY